MNIKQIKNKNLYKVFLVVHIGQVTRTHQTHTGLENHNTEPNMESQGYACHLMVGGTSCSIDNHIKMHDYIYYTGGFDLCIVLFVF